VKDRRAIMKRPVATIANSESRPNVSAAGFAQAEHSADPTSLRRANTDLPNTTAR
jgi:hypothetical protein